MSKLHLVAKKEFNYLNYLAVMTASRSNNVVLWYVEEPEDNKWWKLVKGNRSIELAELPEDRILSMEYGDNTGQMDILYLREFTQDSIDDAFVVHKGLYEPKDAGEFESKDMDLVKVHMPEGCDSLDFIEPEWVKNSGTLLAELIKTICLKRIWNPYER